MECRRCQCGSCGQALFRGYAPSFVPDAGSSDTAARSDRKDGRSVNLTVNKA